MVHRQQTFNPLTNTDFTLPVQFNKGQRIAQAIPKRQILPEFIECRPGLSGNAAILAIVSVQLSANAETSAQRYFRGPYSASNIAKPGQADAFEKLFSCLRSFRQPFSSMITRQPAI